MVQMPTPEGLELSYIAGGVPSRVVAFLLDLLIQAVLTFGVVLAALQLPSAIGQVLATSFGFALTFFYHVFFEVRFRGQTPGKVAMGLRVIRTDGSPVGFVASLTRNTIRLAELSMTALLSTVLVFLFPLTIIALIAPLIFMMRSPSRQRLGDIAADTQVIKIRGTITTSRVVTSGYGFDQPAYDFDDRSWLRRRRGSQSPDPKGSSWVLPGGQPPR